MGNLTLWLLRLSGLQKQKQSHAPRLEESRKAKQSHPPKDWEGREKTMKSALIGRVDVLRSKTSSTASRPTLPQPKCKIVNAQLEQLERSTQVTMSLDPTGSPTKINPLE